MTTPMSRVTIAASIWVGTVALLIMAIQPILLGALVERGVIATNQLGLVATGELFAIAVSSAVGPALLRRGRLRTKVALASLGLALADVATGGAHDMLSLLSVRVAAGVLEGLMMGVTILMMLRGRQPDRLNGLFLALSAIPQALGAYLIPTLILPLFGVRGGFDILAISAVMSAASAVLINLSVDQESPGKSARLKLGLPVATALLGVFLQNAAMGTAWSYVERIASNRGFGAQDVALAAAGTLVMQVVGAALIAWVGWRLPLRATLVLSALAQGAILAGMALGHTAPEYIGAAWVFGLIWLAVIPFQFRLLLELDPSGAAASWAVALNLLGQSAGPLIGTLGVRAGDVTGAFWIAGVLVVVCALLYAAAATVAARNTYLAELGKLSPVYPSGTSAVEP